MLERARFDPARVDEGVDLVLLEADDATEAVGRKLALVDEPVQRPRGDAEATLVQAWGRAPSDAEVAPYWRTMVEMNRAKLVDPGNPGLIYPGQVFVVPAPPVAPR